MPKKKKIISNPKKKKKKKILKDNKYSRCIKKRRTKICFIIIELPLIGRLML